MKNTFLRVPARSRPRRAMSGMSLVELMIGMALGLIVLAALASLFANNSATRNELERTSRQIENGRFAMELLSDELRLAGFYGEYSVAASGPATVTPNPCSVALADWQAAIPVHVFAYDNGDGVPDCVPADRKANTDVLVTRRIATCEAGVGSCPAAANDVPYFQISKCSPENVANPYRLGLYGTATFDLKMRNCGTAAGIRRYLPRIYYVSTDNGNGVAVPTLKRVDLEKVSGGAWVTTITPLVEGIEELNIEYGLDWTGDGSPDGYVANPTTYAGCAGCGPVANWANVMTARINLLARNVDTSPNYTDPKTYSLGLDAAGNPVTVTPGGAYRRHAYTSLVRVVNAAERREVPK